MTEQITYLEKLLDTCKERYKKGERDLEPKIRQLTSQLQKLYLEQDFFSSKTTVPKPRVSLLQLTKRGCCSGR